MKNLALIVGIAFTLGISTAVLLAFRDMRIRVEDLGTEVSRTNSRMDCELDRAKITYDQATIRVEDWIKTIKGPTDKEIADWVREHPYGDPPPAHWFPNGDPFRNPTAKEMDEYDPGR